jgi:hypothetical protein
VTCTSGTAATWYQKDTQCSCNACSRPHELECWGYNAYGSTDAPPGKFKTVSVSYDYSCGVYAECNGHDVVDEIVPGTDKSQCELANSVICWGRNLFGQVTPPKDICKGADRAATCMRLHAARLRLPRADASPRISGRFIAACLAPARLRNGSTDGGVPWLSLVRVCDE